MLLKTKLPEHLFQQELLKHKESAMAEISGVSSRAYIPQFPSWRTAASDEKSLAAKVSDLGSRIISTGGPALAATGSIAAASTFEYSLYLLGVATFSGIIGYIAGRIFFSCFDTVSTTTEKVETSTKMVASELDDTDQELAEIEKELSILEKENANSRNELDRIKRELEAAKKELDAVSRELDRFPYGTLKDDYDDDDDDTGAFSTSRSPARLHMKQTQKDEITDLRNRLKFLEAEYDSKMEKRLGKLDDKVTVDTEN